MAIHVENINTAGAVVTVGGAVNAADGDGYFIGTTGGTDVGCTTGGVSVSYTYETQDTFCDQTLAAIGSSITSEAAEIAFEMLETNSENLRFAIGQYVSTDDANDKKTGVGGVAAISYVPLMLEVYDNDDATHTRRTTWTFFKVRPGGLETKFERENPSSVSVTMTAYADSTHNAGHELFSINEDLT